ncbi:MAG: hypothetical protein FJY97_03185 [candidate division Zixibacteria bacterium]|nr:hypothetical protein [candidate division Zixibacteria bacterium]
MPDRRWHRLLTVCLWVLLIGATLPVFAGGYGESLLRIGVGARALAMGGAFVAIADDGTAAFWNPAGLALHRSPQITAGHAFLFKTLADHSFVNASLPLGRGYTLGLGGIYFKVDNIPVFDALSGGRGGAGPLPVKDTEQVYIFSLAKRYDLDAGSELYGSVPVEFPVAINVKYVRQSFGTASSNGMGMDLGIMAKIGLREATGSENAGHVSMGLSVRDITGTYIRSSGWNETIKPGVRMGFSYTRPLPPLDGTLVVTEQHSLYNAETFQIGAEYWYRNAIAVRLGGYGERFTAGAGLLVGGLMVDYAFFDERLGETHRLGASVRF